MSSEVQIAVIDQQDTQIVLAVPGVQGATGSEIAAGGTANQVLRKASSTNYDTNWSLVTNAMVDSSAAIAGTKISPDFGSQNSVTTGTSTAASFIPTSSTAPTNGVYLPSADQVAISTNGTGRLIVGSTGTVNIVGAGTAGSTQAVSFNGSAPVDSLVMLSDGKVGLGTSNPRSTLNVAGSVGFDSASGSVDIVDGRITYYNAGAADKFIGLSDDSNTINAIGFKKTGASTANVWFPSGNVGIGTTSPVAALDVRSATTWIGDGTTDAFLQFNQSATAANRWHIGTGSSNSLIFYKGTYGTGSETARIDSSGRLLVGTASAVAATPLLQVEQTTGAEIALGRQDTSVVADDLMGGVSFWGRDTSGVAYTEQGSVKCFADGTHDPGTNPTRLVFSTTADGASSPTPRLILKEGGDVVIPSTSATKGLWIGTGDSTGNSASANYRFGQNSTGIGSATFYIGNAAIQVSSDARLKENIEDTRLDALDAVNKIKVKDFTWNDPSDTSVNNRNARGKWTGLIAQELVEILPFVVNAPRKEEDNSIDYESEDRWLLDQSQLCPVLIKAIQQQQEIITGLETRLSVLETK